MTQTDRRASGWAGIHVAPWLCPCQGDFGSLPSRNERPWIPGAVVARGPLWLAGTQEPRRSEGAVIACRRFRVYQAAGSIRDREYRSGPYWHPDQGLGAPRWQRAPVGRHLSGAFGIWCVRIRFSCLRHGRRPLLLITAQKQSFPVVFCCKFCALDGFLPIPISGLLDRKALSFVSGAKQGF